MVSQFKTDSYPKTHSELRIMKLEKTKLLVPFLIIAFAATLLNVRPVSSADTRLQMNPPIMHKAAGETFQTNITVSSVQKLYAWQANMSFNPNVLEFVNVTEGEFMKQQPEGTTSALRLDHIEDGWVLFGWTTNGAYIGEDGGGVLATVEFRVLSVGESPLRFENVGNATYLLGQTAPVAPPQFYDIEFTPEDGLFTNMLTPPMADFTHSPEVPGIDQSITFDASASSATSPLEIVEYFWDFDDGTNATVTTPTIEHTYTTGGIFKVSLTVFDNATASELVQSIYNTTDMPRIWYELYGTKEVTLGIAFAHDIAVTNVTVSQTEIVPGDAVSIDVTVLNQGTESEDFTVTVYYGTNEIETRQVDSLSSGEEKTLTFSWDTTGVAEGNYQIRAVASAVEGEGNIDNNEYVDGTVTVEATTGAFPTTLVVGGVIGVAIVLILILVIYRRRGASTA
jgi:PKD repeat protein